MKLLLILSNLSLTAFAISFCVFAWVGMLALSHEAGEWMHDSVIASVTPSAQSMSGFLFIVGGISFISLALGLGLGLFRDWLRPTQK